MEVVWTTAALQDLRNLLEYVEARSRKGAITISNRIESSVASIASFPRACRRDPDTGVYECVVPGIPVLLIYEIVADDAGDERAEVIAVFHTSRDPETKPPGRT